MVADEAPGAQVHHPWLRAPLLPRAAPKTRPRSGAEAEQLRRHRAPTADLRH